MTIKSTTLTLSGALLLCAAQLAIADTTFSPAKFGFTGSDIAHAITTKEENANIAIYCQSNIDSDGRNLKTQCYERSGDMSLEQQANKAISQQQFIPATADGQGVAVRMNYRVILQKDAQSKTVLLVPNLGSLQSTLGVNYSEPQEQISSGWFASIASKFSDSNSFFAKGKSLTRAKAIVSDEGKANNITMIDDASHTQATIMENALKDSAFIPGFVDGKASEMPYLAIVTR